VVLAQSQSRNVNGFRLSRERPHDGGDALLKLLGAVREHLATTGGLRQSFDHSDYVDTHVWLQSYFPRS